MKRRIAEFGILALMLLGLPLGGILVSGLPLSRYLEFPPRTLYVLHAPFSWPAFCAYAIFILAIVSPFLVSGLRSRPKSGETRAGSLPFPWWGRLGVLLGAAAWALAWAPFQWSEVFQALTFPALWAAYILTVNGLACRRTGRCPLVDRPGRYLLLFPASAVFWWFFEYLNRFVQNWYYLGDPLGRWEYFLFATLAFSTVLPGFAGTQAWILSFDWPGDKFNRFLAPFLLTPKNNLSYHAAR